ncbi:MAG TPA: hypothetical protein VF815_12430 [Myxococcaceae bacterium]|jgi:hypothetical protein
MYGLLLALVLTQAPTAGKPSAVVLVERRVGLSPQSAQSLAGEVSELLEKENLPIAAAPEQVDACEEERSCLLERARELGATVAVLMKANELEDTLTINLEAIAVEDGSSLWKDLFLLTGDSPREQELKEGVAPLAQTLRPKLAPPEPAPIAEARPIPDAPVVTPPAPASALTPSAAKPEPIPLKPQPPAPPGKRSRTLLYATGGGTIAAVGAAVTFGLMGRGQKRQLDDARFTDSATGRTASRLTQAQAERTSSRANLYFNVALSSALVSAVLGTTTGYLWLKDDPSP